MTKPKKKSQLEFIDSAQLYLKAGDGGKGCLSFRREKFIPYGGPNGGDGGRGGDIYIRASSSVNTLFQISRHPHAKAENGGPGKGKNLFGPNAEDTIIDVPPGTIVKTGDIVLADLKEDGDILLAAKGGRGGRGNASFKSQKNPAPKISEKGEPGEELTVRLELSVLADVGLVGFPNAGKSTFLSVVTNARPRVADYPFTTLNPNLGIAYHKGKTFVIADIPGIIEGAHEGRGLGDIFLKHLMRTKLLLHFIDPLGFGETEPIKTIKLINNELKSFHPGLAKKKQILVVNKSDLSEAKKIYVQIKKKYSKIPLFLISSVSLNGLDKLLNKTLETLEQIKPQEVFKPLKKVSHILKVDKGFEIIKNNEGILEVKGKNIVKIVSMTNFDQAESLRRLQKIFKIIRLNKFLSKSGIKPGDIIRIGHKEFEWFPEESKSGKISKFQYKYPQQLKKRRKTKR